MKNIENSNIEDLRLFVESCKQRGADIGLDEVIIDEFGNLRISNFLRDVCQSLKNKIQKNQDLEASMMSEMEFKGQNEVIDRLEELEIITSN